MCSSQFTHEWCTSTHYWRQHVHRPSPVSSNDPDKGDKYHSKQKLTISWTDKRGQSTGRPLCVGRGRAAAFKQISKSKIDNDATIGADVNRIRTQNTTTVAANNIDIAQCVISGIIQGNTENQLFMIMVESKQYRRHRRQAVQTSVIIGVLSMSNNNFASAFSPIHHYLSPTTAATVSKPELICGREVMKTVNFNKSPLYASKRQSPLEDEPWKKDSSYWDSLQAASKDPETFEKFIEESMKRKKMSSSSPSHAMAASAAAATSSSSSQEGGEDKPKKKSKYVPIEEWNEQRTENMSKEERLQWECQRGGNQFRQNEILTQNLKSF